MSRKNRRRHINKYPQATQLSMDLAPAVENNKDRLHMLDGVCAYEYARLPSVMLESDPSYQRTIDMKRVNRIVDNFDSRLVNPLKISNRDGRYYIFDGAHTLAAIKIINKFDNFSVDCKLFHGLTYEDEAYLFALQNGDAKAVATAPRLKALVQSNDEKARDLCRRTEAAGFRLAGNGHSAARKTLGCMAKLWKIYELNPDLYSNTLCFLMEAWHGAVWSLGANVIGGMALFLHVYGQKLSRERFLKQISSADLDTLNHLKDDNSRNKDYSYAFALLRLYNRIGGKGTLMPYDLYEYKY